VWLWRASVLGGRICGQPARELAGIHRFGALLSPGVVLDTDFPLPHGDLGAVLGKRLEEQHRGVY
jgi:hypothetical protein